VSAPVSDAFEAQRRAANPAISAWVMANAGSGKTRVLIDRVIRLLLAGRPPPRRWRTACTSAWANGR
jgi:ATP-dependent helicase/nuclease subunit A